MATDETTRRTLVCDLDETIICATRDPSFFEYRPCDFVFEKILFFKRPHVDDMLLHAHALGFQFAIFTAASAAYANAVVEHVFVPLGINPVIVLSHKHCIQRIEWNTEKDRLDCYSIKPLLQLWSSRRIHTHDILLIDDKICSAKHDPLNLFHIDAFTGKWSDTSLLTFKHVLSFIQKQTHMRTMNALQFYYAIQRLPVQLIERIVMYV